jgi:hypothetical protein
MNTVTLTHREGLYSAELFFTCIPEIPVILSDSSCFFALPTPKSWVTPDLSISRDWFLPASLNTDTHLIDVFVLRHDVPSFCATPDVVESAALFIKQNSVTIQSKNKTEPNIFFVLCAPQLTLLERIQHFKHYTLIYLLQHVPAVYVGHQQIQSQQHKWKVYWDRVCLIIIPRWHRPVCIAYN